MSRGTAGSLPDRLQALERALDAGEGRLAPDAVADARALLDRADARLKLSGEHTVVALAGATGSGKSSLFNALAGLDLAPVGVRRPTTSAPMACVWGPEGAGPLVEWLGIPKRHQFDRETVLDADRQSALRGLVLLDLPDHDSTELSHRLTVDRLVEMVDLLVWVVDPQKYADQALHEHYLRRFAGHRAVMVVVLNQIDTLPPADAVRCLEDLQRLLTEDGLDGVSLLTTAAPTKDGVPAVRDALVRAVSRREAVSSRLEADIDAVVDRLAEGVASGEANGVGRRERRELLAALGAAAGVPAVVHATASSYRHRAAARTGWAAAVRRAARPADDDLADALDAAVVATPLGVERRPWWWLLAGALQWLFALAAIVGLLWLVALFSVAWLQLPEPPTYDVGRIPLPTLLLVGGLLAGLLLALIARIVAGIGARRRARRAESRLREGISGVAQERVIDPVMAELNRHRETREQLRRARSR